MMNHELDVQIRDQIIQSTKRIDYLKWMRDLFISKCFNGSRFLIFEIDKGNKKYFEFVALRPTGSKAHSINQKRYFL